MSLAIAVAAAAAAAATAAAAAADAAGQWSVLSTSGISDSWLFARQYILQPSNLY